MGSPLFPRESGQFVAERSRDVFVEEKGVQKVAEMLYALRQSGSLTASSWKKANPLAPASTSDQGSYEYTSGELQGTFDIFHVEETSGVIPLSFEKIGREARILPSILDGLLCCFFFFVFIFSILYVYKFTSHGGTTNIAPSPQNICLKGNKQIF